MIRISKLLTNKDNLHYIKTNKYKDINLFIKCAFPYKDGLKARLSLLSAMLDDRCNKYPSKVEMSKIKDLLYGLTYVCTINNDDGLLILTFIYSFTNPRFTSGVSENDYIDFIEETINNPLLNEDSFNDNKRNLIDSIKRKLDKPSKLADNSFYKEAAKEDDRYKAYNDDIIADINSLNLNDIKDTYADLFNYQTDVYLIGDFSDNFINYLSKYKSNKRLLIDSRPFISSNSKEIVDKKEYGQSTLIMSYTAPFTRKMDEYCAYNVGVVLFGQTATSLLFSEVREKLSLCYSIFAMPSKNTGLVMISTNIDKKNKDKAISEIKRQYKRIVDKDYDLSLIEIAKKMIVNSMNSLDDDLDYLINFHYRNMLIGNGETIDEYNSRLNNVTADDISNVFAKFNEYITYFLEGTVDEKNI